jgi:hypothetical protein
MGGINYVLGYKHYYEEGFATGAGALRKPGCGLRSRRAGIVLELHGRQAKPVVRRSIPLIFLQRIQVFANAGLWIAGKLSGVLETPRLRILAFVGFLYLIMPIRLNV